MKKNNKNEGNIANRIKKIKLTKIDDKSCDTPIGNCVRFFLLNGEFELLNGDFEEDFCITADFAFLVIDEYNKLNLPIPRIGETVGLDSYTRYFEYEIPQYDYFSVDKVHYNIHNPKTSPYSLVEIYVTGKYYNV